MGKAFYRKYRSRKLSEIVGQEHITTVLDNSLKAGKINHAYLFTGPKGVGKTSIARILAHEVNKLPYDEETSHIDIIEIDAASNRRIDEIRDLREKAHIAPTSAKYKVYIIDEVHMLTREAFNALLKTLEEPPAHVIFILATTEAHKLPETIISRTQRFSFKPIKDSDAVVHLKNIAKKEGIKAADEAIDLIAQHSEGSFRDSIGLLEQASNANGDLDAATVRSLLGIAPAESIANLHEMVTSGSPSKLIQLLDDLKQQGLSAPNLAKQLGDKLREELIDQHSTLPAKEATRLLESLLGVSTSSKPDQLLEIVLLRTAMAVSQKLTIPSHKDSRDNTERESHNEPRKPTTEPAPPLEKSLKTAAGSKKSNSSTTVKSQDNFSTKIWPKVLDDLKKNHSTLYGILRMCQPVLSGNTLTLAFQFPFHQKQINEAQNRQKLADIITRHHSHEITIETVVDLMERRAPTTVVTASPQPIDTITNIFGGGEVLES